VTWYIHQREGKTYYFMTERITWGLRAIDDLKPAHLEDLAADKDSEGNHDPLTF
jgi:hypothetical protein